MALVQGKQVDTKALDESKLTTTAPAGEVLQSDGAGGVVVDPVSHDDLTAVSPNDHHTEDHAGRHIGASAPDEVDGDQLDIDFTPINYTPDASPPEAGDVDDLAAHLKGIDTAVGTGLPVPDTTELVKGSVDDTKKVRIEADGLTTGVTRVITMPDQNIDLTPGTDFAAVVHIHAAIDVNSGTFANGRIAQSNVTQHQAALSIAASQLTGDVAIADGGTGASTAAGARTNLGLVINTDVQAHDADLDAISVLAVIDGNFIVGNGTAWVAESGNTARTSLGLGTTDDPSFNRVTVSKRLTANERFQAFTAVISGQGTFQTVNFPVAFPSAPIVVGNMVAGNNDAAIIVRNITTSSFQFRARNIAAQHSVHTGTQTVNFLAMVA